VIHGFRGYLGVAALAGALIGSALPGHARGPGNYNVSGKDAVNGGAYTGTSTLTQTGSSTWRITWRVDGVNFTGSGLGDGDVIALNFAGRGRTGVALLKAKGDGSGYDVSWIYSGDRTVSFEDWRKGR
jgi:hypothetical protein